jgi:hypothetical protein
MPTPQEIRAAGLHDEAAHPFLWTVRLPALDKLPGLATDITLAVLEDDETTEEGNIHGPWVEDAYEDRDGLYRDAVAFMRGSSWRAGAAARVERTKWMAQRLPKKEGRYSFGLPLVSLLVTEWSILRPFSDGARAQDYPERQYNVLGRGDYVPAEEARAYLWRKYGLNLSLLAAYEQAQGGTMPNSLGNPLRGLITPASSASALAFFGISGAGIADTRNPLMSPPLYAPKVQPYFLRKLQRASVFATNYVSLHDLAVLIGHIERGLFDFIRGIAPRQLGPNNPALSCGICFPTEKLCFGMITTNETDRAEVLYVDGPEIEPKATAPLPGGLKGKPLDTYKKLLRLRGERGEIDVRLLMVWEHKSAIHEDLRQSKHEAPGLDGLDPFLQKQNAAALVNERLLQEQAGLEAEGAKKSGEVRGLYRDLLRTLAKDKERILEGSRQYAVAKANDEARDKQLAGKRAAYTPLADVGIEAFAHMTVLPAGVDMQVLPFREAALGIAALQIERPGFRTAAPRQLEMRELYPRESGLPSLMDAANATLRMPGLFAVGYVGFAKLAKDANAYERVANIETLATDFWCTINPANVREDIRSDGLENWWKKKHRSVRNPVQITATEAFIRLALFLNDVGIPIITRNRTGVISGIIQLGAVEAVHRNGGNVGAIKWRPNPEISRLITGAEGETPHYMVVNHAAMFAYGGTERNVCPALQLWCEHRTRAAYFSGNLQKFGGWLVTPAQDGTTLATIAERMGFPDGRKPSEAVRRIQAGLETLKKAGVVSEIQWGPTRRNAFEQQVKIRMSDDYLPLYDGARLKAEVRKHAAFLKAPFSPPKRAKKVA